VPPQLDEQALLVDLPDGRLLEVAIAGPKSGTPLVFHHGTPMAGVLFGPLVTAAAECGLRTVAYSRPGYGRSTPHFGRSVADATADVAAILDAVGAESFYALGWSGGGPHALACAALLPHRCLAAASLAGVAPWAASGLNWLADMGDENIEALTPFLEREAAKLRDIQPDEVAAALGSLVSEVDRAALTGEYAEFSARSMRHSLSSGIAGWRDDDLAFTRPWGFELDSIRRPVAIWQGGQDRMVPYAHGEWLGEHIVGAQKRLFPGEGHLSLGVGQVTEIVTDLVALGSAQVTPEQV
jgi:pimeloyl-ACP methyl ester carboxylesterase